MTRPPRGTPAVSRAAEFILLAAVLAASNASAQVTYDLAAVRLIPVFGPSTIRTYLLARRAIQAGDVHVQWRTAGGSSDVVVHATSADRIVQVPAFTADCSSSPCWGIEVIYGSADTVNGMVPLTTVNSAGGTANYRGFDIFTVTVAQPQGSGSPVITLPAATVSDPSEQRTYDTGPKSLGGGTNQTVDVGCANLSKSAATGLVKVTSNTGAITAIQSVLVPPNGVSNDVRLPASSALNLSLLTSSFVVCAARTSDGQDLTFHKRLANRWMLRGSFIPETWSWGPGPTAPVVTFQGHNNGSQPVTANFQAWLYNNGNVSLYRSSSLTIPADGTSSFPFTVACTGNCQIEVLLFGAGLAKIDPNVSLSFSNGIFNYERDEWDFHVGDILEQKSPTGPPIITAPPPGPPSPFQKVPWITGLIVPENSSTIAPGWCFNRSNTDAAVTSTVTDASGATSTPQLVTIPAHGFGTVNSAISSPSYVSVVVPLTGSVTCTVQPPSTHEVDEANECPVAPEDFLAAERCGFFIGRR